MPFRPMAQHSHFLLAKRVMVMFMGPEAYAQSPEAYILLVDKPTQWQWASPLKKIKSNKQRLFSILWLLFSQNVSRSALMWSVWLCKIWIL